MIVFKTIYRSIKHDHPSLHDRVVVKRLEAEEKPHQASSCRAQPLKNPDMGEVIAVGAGKIGKDGARRPLDVKVGDKVIFGKYSGQTVKAEAKSCW